jgi:hypothetical protein
VPFNIESAPTEEYVHASFSLCTFCLVICANSLKWLLAPSPWYSIQSVDGLFRLIVSWILDPFDFLSGEVQAKETANKKGSNRTLQEFKSINVRLTLSLGGYNRVIGNILYYHNTVIETSAPFLSEET